MVELRTVAVIGAGPLGRTLALLSAAARFRTILEDVLPSHLRRAQAEADASARRGDARPGNHLTFATSVEEASRHADIIIDSVPDELESKLEIFSMLDRMAPPRSILLTPTRTLSIADLASCTYRPERCVAFEVPPGGLVAGTPLRLIHTGGTEQAVLAAVSEFWQRLGFQPASELDPAEVNLIRDR